MKAGLWTKDDIEQVIQAEFQKLMLKNPLESAAGNVQQKPPEEGSRELQVIVGGFEENTEGKVVIDTINDLLSKENRKAKITDVGTFTDPTQIGYIEFQTESAKLAFYRKIKNVEKLQNNVELWFTDNRTFEERRRDKALALIKYHLIETKKSIDCLSGLIGRVALSRSKGRGKLPPLPMTQRSPLQMNSLISKMQLMMALLHGCPSVDGSSRMEPSITSTGLMKEN